VTTPQETKCIQVIVAKASPIPKSAICTNSQEVGVAKKPRQTEPDFVMGFANSHSAN